MTREEKDEILHNLMNMFQEDTDQYKALGMAIYDSGIIEDLKKQRDVALKTFPKHSNIRINLNDSVKVKLTDLGREIFYHKFDGVNEHWGREVIKPHFPKHDDDGYSTFQLWDFMSLYGEHMGMCKNDVIEPLELIYRTHGRNNYDTN